jgi:hypothetical protein
MAWNLDLHRRFFSEINLQESFMVQFHIEIEPRINFKRENISVFQINHFIE